MENKITIEMALKLMKQNGGSLNLRGTDITSLPDNLTVGGYLDLERTNITNLPDDLTVGGGLDLEGTNITSLPNDLTVGGGLYLEGTNITNTSMVSILKDGDYEEGRYIYCDGKLTHIKKKKRLFNKYDYYIGKIKNNNVIFDGKYYAHCKNIKQGVSDLEFKRAKDRGSEQYKNISLNDIFTLEEAKTMYRVLTGACQQGTDDFVNNLGKKVKDKYSIQEMIDLTKGYYESSIFRSFFITVHN